MSVGQHRTGPFQLERLFYNLYLIIQVLLCTSMNETIIQIIRKLDIRKSTINPAI